MNSYQKKGLQHFSTFLAPNFIYQLPGFPYRLTESRQKCNEQEGAPFYSKAEIHMRCQNIVNCKQAHRNYCIVKSLVKYVTSHSNDVMTSDAGDKIEFHHSSSIAVTIPSSPRRSLN